MIYTEEMVVNDLYFHEAKWNEQQQQNSRSYFLYVCKSVHENSINPLYPLVNNALKVDVQIFGTCVQIIETNNIPRYDKRNAIRYNFTNDFS